MISLCFKGPLIEDLLGEVITEAYFVDGKVYALIGVETRFIDMEA